MTTVQVTTTPAFQQDQLSWTEEENEGKKRWEGEQGEQGGRGGRGDEKGGRVGGGAEGGDGGRRSWLVAEMSSIVAVVKKSCLFICVITFPGAADTGADRNGWIEMMCTQTVS